MVNDAQRLPDGWTSETIKTITVNFDGKRIPVKASDREKMAGEFPYYGASGIIDHVNKYIFDGDYLLIAEDGANLLSRSTPIAFSAHGKFWVNNHAHIVQTRETCLSKFLEYYLNSIDLKFYITGTAQPKLTQNNLNKIPVPLAPLPEQERIVAKIEELFTQLEAGTSALERVQAGLRRYKASVLKAAVEGKLLKDESGRMGDESELPEGWRLVRLDEIAETIGGATKGRKLEGKSTIMLPYLRVANVQRGRLELDVMKEIEILKSEFEKYQLHDGDVVLTEGGDWDKLGRSAIWRNQIPNCIHQNHIFRARVKASEALPEWLMYYTNSEPGQDYFKESSKQTTNLASINLTQLRACPIPLPPLEEQRRIVGEVERRLSVTREVESVVEKALVRASRLRQAVLRSAFEGKLVNGL